MNVSNVGKIDNLIATWKAARAARARSTYIPDTNQLDVWM